MTIRAQLLSLVGLLFLGLSALAGGVWWNATGMLQEVRKAGQVEAVTHNVSETMGAWAIEQEVVARALSGLPSFSLEQVSVIEAQRKIASVRASRGLTAASGLGTARFDSLLREAHQAHIKLIALQNRVDLALSDGNLGGDFTLSDDWLEGASAAVKSFAAVRDAVSRYLPPLDPKLVDSEAVRHSIHQITEHASRERELLAGAIIANRALTPAEIAIFAEARGHITAGWAMLLARRHLHTTVTRQAIDSAQQFFLNNFEDLRLAMQSAVATGDYPVTANEWSSRSTLAIESVRAVQTALHREMLELLADLESRAQWSVRLSIAALATSVILLLISLRVILVGVARDLENQRDGIIAIEKQERLSSLGALVAGVAHEINTPIGVAVTAASYLADLTRQLDCDYHDQAVTRSSMEEYIESAAEGSTMILRNLERAASLISSFKRISVDQTSDEQRDFNLTQLVNDVLVTLRPQIRLTPHRVNANCPPELKMSGSPGLVAQIITNLVMNSLTHAFPGGRVGQIEITAVRKAGLIRLIYRDDGVGAPEYVQRRMFEPFFTTKRGSGGSGLGLSIVHTLVTQKLGGEIAVTSADPGLRFEIALPTEIASAAGSSKLKLCRLSRLQRDVPRWIGLGPFKTVTQTNGVKKC